MFYRYTVSYNVPRFLDFMLDWFFSRNYPYYVDWTSKKYRNSGRNIRTRRIKTNNAATSFVLYNFPTPGTFVDGDGTGKGGIKKIKTVRRSFPSKYTGRRPYFRRATPIVESAEFYATVTSDFRQRFHSDFDESRYWLDIHTSAPVYGSARLNDI